MLHEILIEDKGCCLPLLSTKEWVIQGGSHCTFIISRDGVAYARA